MEASFANLMIMTISLCHKFPSIFFSPNFFFPFEGFLLFKYSFYFKKNVEKFLFSFCFSLLSEVTVNELQFDH